MRLNCRWLAVLLLLAVMPLSGCSFLQKLKARDSSNKGVKAFAEQKYNAAAQYFEKAVELDPDFEEARMYLGTAYMNQFIPGSTDPKSEQMAQKGIAVFKYIVEHAKDPNHPNKNAMLTIANIYYQLKQYDQSKEWCNRILKVYPDNAEAYYRIAVMDYDDAQEKTGIQGEQVGFLSPEEKKKTLENISEGLTCLDKAIELRTNYFDAMDYQNLLWRMKAYFEKDEKAKAELIRQADLVYQKALKLKLKDEEEKAARLKKMGPKTQNVE